MEKLSSSLAILVGDVALKARALCLVELAIVKFEIAQKRGALGRAMAWLLAGSLLGVGALALILNAALLWVISLGLSPLLASCAVALVLAFAASLVVRRALILLRGLTFNLDETKAEIRKTAELWTRGQANE